MITIAERRDVIFLRVSVWPRSRRPALRALFAASLVVATLLTTDSRTSTGPATLRAAGGPQNRPLSVHITSPLGRLGLRGAIRIVAQVSHPAQVALESVSFYV